MDVLRSIFTALGLRFGLSRYHESCAYFPRAISEPPNAKKEILDFRISLHRLMSKYAH